MINWSLPRWIIFLIIARFLIFAFQVPSGHDVFGLLMTSGVLLLVWTQLGTRKQLRPFLFGVVLYWFGNLFDWFDGLLHKHGRWGVLVDTLDDIFFTAGFFFIGIAFIRVMQESKQLELSLYAKAFRDELTELGNRRALFDELKNILSLQSGTLLYLDINQFKPVNDQFGHATGDIVLCECANILRTTAHPAYRIGGDEFVLLLPASVSVADIVDDLNRCIQSLTAQYGISWSIGTARFQANTAPDPDALLALADQQMYRSKHLHRQQNRKRN